MTATATPCTRHGCRLTTKHPSGRCRHHQADSGSRIDVVSPPAPVPTSSAPASVCEVHTSADGSYVNRWVDARGQLHREDGPAVEWHDEDGNLDLVSYFRHGTIHRDEGPAYLRYAADGSVMKEEWSRRGKVHRIDGPATVDYAPDGSVLREEWRFEGVRKIFHEEMIEAVSAWDTRRLRRELASTRYAPLLTEGVHPTRILDGLREEISTVEGLRAYLDGAPAEWVRSFEAGSA